MKAWRAIVADKPALWRRAIAAKPTRAMNLT